jgi:heptosyltransferase-3
MSHDPARVLVICTRRLGDVLLCTALLKSLRKAYPDARLDVLVFRSSAAVLSGNPDINDVIAVPERMSFAENLALLRRIFRAYDLALPALISDRAHLLAFLAASRRVGVVPQAGEKSARWKRWLCSEWTPLATHECHVAEQYLRLVDCLGIERQWELQPPRPEDTSRLDLRLGTEWREQNYAVLHPAPMYPYKAWTLEGWRSLVRWLLEHGTRVYLTGGPAESERRTVAEVAEGFGDAVVDLAGALSFAELTPLIERALAFVGPDTSTTHLAAATGAPTIALFGPSGPRAWGPWPRGWRGSAPSPWELVSTLQQEGNVWIVQGITHCAPCLQEGCARHLQSRSVCLDEMPSARVYSIVNEILLRSNRSGRTLDQ